MNALGKTYKDMNKNLRKPNNHPHKHEKPSFIDSVKDMAYGGVYEAKAN